MRSFAEVHVARLRYLLVFQASEEALHWDIIPTVSPSTHALFNSITLQQLLELPACIVAALIAAVHYPGWFAKRTDSELKRDMPGVYRPSSS